MEVANICLISRHYLYNHMIVGKLRDKASFGYENGQFVENGVLDMERVLQKFQEIMKAEYRTEDAKNTICLKGSQKEIYEITV